MNRQNAFIKTCCITGNRPHKFPFDYRNETSHERMLYINALYDKVEELMRRGYTHFITGMACGADLDFACAVLFHKEETFRDILDISLEVAIPHPDQTAGWRDSDLELYDYVLSHCDKKTLLSSTYYRGCEQRRNVYMVDHSDLVLAVWNGEEKGGTWNTIRYAARRGKPTEFLYLRDFCGQ